MTPDCRSETCDLGLSGQLPLSDISCLRVIVTGSPNTTEQAVLVVVFWWFSLCLLVGQQVISQLRSLVISRNRLPCAVSSQPEAQAGSVLVSTRRVPAAQPMVMATLQMQAPYGLQQMSTPKISASVTAVPYRVSGAYRHMSNHMAP